MTPKQKVLAKWPKAYAYMWTDCWTIYLDKNNVKQGMWTGLGPTPRAAWADAAKRMGK